MTDKHTITQRDFSLGCVVPELIEGDDTEIRQKSLIGGKNVRVTRGRTLRQRPGLEYKMEVTSDQHFNDMRVHNGSSEERYIVVVENNGVTILNSSYGTETSFTGAPWATTPENVWTAQFGNTMVFGGFEFYGLTFEEGSWSFGALDFADNAESEKALPFWAYERGVTLTPSDYTGTITVTASSAIFSTDWVGKRLRYAGRAMEVTAYTSATQLQCEVTTELPPTFLITFPTSNDLSGFAVGQAVTADTTDWSGIVAEIDSANNRFYAVTLSNTALADTSTTTSSYGGPTTDDTIVGPNSAASPNAVARQSTPKGIQIWDEQLWSDDRGWPQSGTEVNGRLALCNFPGIPNLVCISSSRGFNDFEAGVDDDDAILRTAGNRNPRFRHIVTATDLILLANNSAYYVKTRDGELLTPSNFQAIEFSDVGSSEVKPISVEGGVVFVDNSRDALSAAVLSGNVYLNWTTVDLTRFHSHLINAPVKISSPADSADLAERYLFVVNDTADSGKWRASFNDDPAGRLAAMSWYTSFGEERVGFVPWETEGNFVDAVPLLGKQHFVITRGSKRTLEVINPDYYMDGAIDVSGVFTSGGQLDHLPEGSVTAWDGYESETLTNDSSGNTSSEPTKTGHIGLPFDVSAKPWPQEAVQSPRHGMLKARVIRASVGVMDTITFKFVRNSTTSTAPARRPQDSATAAPPLKTDVYRFNVFGNRVKPDMEVLLDEPNPLEITSITQEVQA